MSPGWPSAGGNLGGSPGAGVGGSWEGVRPAAASPPPPICSFPEARSWGRGWGRGRTPLVVVVWGVRPRSVAAGEPSFLFQAAPHGSHAPPAAVCRGLYFCRALPLFPVPVSLLVLVSPLTVSPLVPLSPSVSGPSLSLLIPPTLVPVRLSVLSLPDLGYWATSPSPPPCTHPDMLFLALLCPTSFGRE